MQHWMFWVAGIIGIAIGTVTCSRVDGRAQRVYGSVYDAGYDGDNAILAGLGMAALSGGALLGVFAFCVYVL